MPKPLDKAAFAGHMTHCLISHARTAKTKAAAAQAGDVDGMKLILILAGVAVETALVFDEPDLALVAFYDRLALVLGSDSVSGALTDGILPNATMIDRETEQGRAMARHLFEDWVYTPQDFMDSLLDVAHMALVGMEESEQPRAETFRLLMECANRCMAYEIAAQELCDIVIDRKMGAEGWSLAESISGLSAVSGRSLALAFSCELPGKYKAHDLPEYFERVAHVMTQEATRHGIPAGANWRFGLAANDQPTSAPYELIAALEPACREFFRVIHLNSLVDQAVACAKASGRMLALATAGDRPELEPVIAKPLAMAAMSDTYKTVCREFAIA